MCVCVCVCACACVFFLELLRLKDQQIVLLLKEKVNIFKDLCDLSPALDEGSQPIGERMLFRATPDEVTKGEPIIKDALKEGVCGWKERLRCVNLLNTVPLSHTSPATSPNSPNC